MFESSRAFTITDWAWNSDKKHEHDPKMWDDLVAPQIEVLKKLQLEQMSKE
jgi:homogentisate 1,2-dioxygenase